MSNKKPVTDKVINQQEIKSISIDTDNEIISVEIELYLETNDGVSTNISNKSIVRKQLLFSDVPNIIGVLTSINNLV